jgi:hypothetical protein
MGSRILVLAMMGWMGVGMGMAQTAPAASAPAKAPAAAAGKAPAAKTGSKAKAAKVPMAVWSSDVMHAFGVLPSQFAGSGLAKLTQEQLDAILAVAKQPKGTLIACPAVGAGGGKTRVLVKVSGEDATDAISAEIKKAVGELSDVTLVDGVGDADATLGVVVQALTVNKKTIGYTASYVLGTPCTETAGEKKTPVELKGVLGSMMNAKSAGLAETLAMTVDKELALAQKTTAAK